MDVEMKSACIRAAARLGFGLSIVAALIGIRIVTAKPAGLGAGLDKLAELEEEIAAEALAQREDIAAPPISETDEGDANRSMVGQLSGAVRGRLGGDDGSARERDQMVSCRLGRSIQFMRAHDCAMRGGRAEVVALKR